MKWIAPLSTYLAVAVGIFVFHSAWGALLGFHLAIVVSLLIAKPNIPIQSLFTAHKIKWLILSVLLCGSSGVILYFAWNYFGFAGDLAAQIEVLGLNETTWPPFITYFALINPWIEEYFWRGFLGNNTARLHISDFLYSGFHGLILINKVQTGSILFALAALVLAGWFWRQVLREDKGLLAPVLGHMAADLTILLAVYFRA